MARNVIALLIIAVCPVAFGGAWVPYNWVAEAPNIVSAEAYKKVDFLVPSALASRQKLSDCIATYDVIPSFSLERHWCLHRRGSAYVLEAWESSAHGAKTNRSGERRTVDLSSVSATLIRDIWLNAILESHYPRFMLGGLDGDTYYFGAVRDDSRLLLGAETWSPRADLPPRWLAEAGDRIFSFAQADSRDDAQLRTALAALRNRLFSYYTKHGRY